MLMDLEDDLSFNAGSAPLLDDPHELLASLLGLPPLELLGADSPSVGSSGASSPPPGPASVGDAASVASSEGPPPLVAPEDDGESAPSSSSGGSPRSEADGDGASLPSENSLNDSASIADSSSIATDDALMEEMRKDIMNEESKLPLFPPKVAYGYCMGPIPYPVGLPAMFDGGKRCGKRKLADTDVEAGSCTTGNGIIMEVDADKGTNREEEDTNQELEDISEEHKDLDEESAVDVDAVDVDENHRGVSPSAGKRPCIRPDSPGHDGVYSVSVPPTRYSYEYFTEQITYRVDREGDILWPGAFREARFREAYDMPGQPTTNERKTSEFFRRFDVCIPLYIQYARGCRGMRWFCFERLTAQLLVYRYYGRKEVLGNLRVPKRSPLKRDFSYIHYHVLGLMAQLTEFNKPYLMKELVLHSIVRYGMKAFIKTMDTYYPSRRWGMCRLRTLVVGPGSTKRSTLQVLIKANVLLGSESHRRHMRTFLNNISEEELRDATNPSKVQPLQDYIYNAFQNPETKELEKQEFARHEKLIEDFLEPRPNTNVSFAGINENENVALLQALVVSLMRYHLDVQLRKSAEHLFELPRSQDEKILRRKVKTTCVGVTKGIDTLMELQSVMSVEQKLMLVSRCTSLIELLEDEEQGDD